MLGQVSLECRQLAVDWNNQVGFTAYVANGVRDLMEAVTNVGALDNRHSIRCRELSTWRASCRIGYDTLLTT